MVLEAARAVAQLPHPPRRSIRFALWTEEEPGLLGSRAYVKAHAKDSITAWLLLFTSGARAGGSSRVATT